MVDHKPSRGVSFFFVLGAALSGTLLAGATARADDKTFDTFLKGYDWDYGAEVMRSLIRDQQRFRPAAQQLTRHQLYPKGSPGSNGFRTVFSTDFDGSAGNTMNLPVTIVAKEDILLPNLRMSKGAAFRDEAGRELFVHGVTGDDADRDIADLKALYPHLPWTDAATGRILTSKDFRHYDNPDRVKQTRLYPSFLTQARRAAREGALNVVVTGRTKIDLASAFHEKFTEYGIPLAAIIAISDASVKAQFKIDPRLSTPQVKAFFNMVLAKMVEPDELSYGDDDRDIITEYLRRMPAWSPSPRTRFRAYDVNHVVDARGRVQPSRWELIATSNAQGQFVDPKGVAWDEARISAHPQRPQPKLPRLTPARIARSFGDRLTAPRPAKSGSRR